MDLVGAAALDVLLVDHDDSYTWNLAHLLAEVTGRLPDVVQHREVERFELERRTHVVLSPGPGRPDDPADFRGLFDLDKALADGFELTLDAAEPAGER